MVLRLLFPPKPVQNFDFKLSNSFSLKTSNFKLLDNEVWGVGIIIYLSLIHSKVITNTALTHIYNLKSLVIFCGSVYPSRHKLTKTCPVNLTIYGTIQILFLPCNTTTKKDSENTVVNIAGDWVKVFASPFIEQKGLWVLDRHAVRSQMISRDKIT